jgi:surfactin synthase thioesterase subunit
VEPRLFIFPHAGGTAEFYAPFARAFSAASRIKCVAVQYPGKKAGRDLSRYNSIPELADRVILRRAGGPASSAERDSLNGGLAAAIYLAHV